MNPPPLSSPEGKPIVKHVYEKYVTLYAGGVHASDESIVIKTLLGSCVAVCLFDPEQHVGGMNHFLLPQGRTGESNSDATRFGMHAMDRLIAAVMKVGGDRRRVIAKVFGGAHVLDSVSESPNSVPRQNSAFAREFLLYEGIPVKVWDVGGNEAREVHFYPRTGRAFVRRLRDAQKRDRLVQREQAEEVKRPPFGSVTLFDPE
jgi:chemotaxis protein CheD